eukprot:gene15404-biopygen5414
MEPEEETEGNRAGGNSPVTREAGIPPPRPDVVVGPERWGPYPLADGHLPLHSYIGPPVAGGGARLVRRWNAKERGRPARLRAAPMYAAIGYRWSSDISFFRVPGSIARPIPGGAR